MRQINSQGRQISWATFNIVVFNYMSYMEFLNGFLIEVLYKVEWDGTALMQISILARTHRVIGDPLYLYLAYLSTPILRDDKEVILKYHTKFYLLYLMF